LLLRIKHIKKLKNKCLLTTPILDVLLNTNYKPHDMVSPTLKVNPTLFVIPCHFQVKNRNDNLTCSPNITFMSLSRPILICSRIVTSDLTTCVKQSGTTTHFSTMRDVRKQWSWCLVTRVPCPSLQMFSCACNFLIIPLRANSHTSQVLGPKSLKVNPCN
jgi:hypothetical protein